MVYTWLYVGRSVLMLLFTVCSFACFLCFLNPTFTDDICMVFGLDVFLQRPEFYVTFEIISSHVHTVAFHVSSNGGNLNILKTRTFLTVFSYAGIGSFQPLAAIYIPLLSPQHHALHFTVRDSQMRLPTLGSISKDQFDSLDVCGLQHQAGPFFLLHI